MKKRNVSYDDKSIFRLRILHFGTAGKGYGYNIKHLMDWPWDTFMLPEKMSAKEGFLILSYLIRKIEQDLKLEECSPRAVKILNENLAKYHFRYYPVLNHTIVDLITVDGDMKRFKKSEYYARYFNWFTDDVSFEQAKAIYDKYGYEFEEPRFDLLYIKF